MIKAQARCPFYKSDTGKKLKCECVDFEFPDIQAKKDYINKYCIEHWSKCSISEQLERYYERTL